MVEEDRQREQAEKQAYDQKEKVDLEEEVPLQEPAICEVHGEVSVPSMNEFYESSTDKTEQESSPHKEDKKSTNK